MGTRKIPFHSTLDLTYNLSIPAAVLAHLTLTYQSRKHRHSGRAGKPVTAHTLNI